MNKDQLLDALEDQPLPFEWRCVSTRTLGLYIDDGTWQLVAIVEV